MTSPRTFTIFGRDPILIMALVSAAIQLATALGLPLTIDQQGILNTVVAAVAGLIGAASLQKEKVAGSVIALFKALIAAAVAFGLHLTPDVQSSVMVLVTAALAAYTRTQVVAKPSSV